MKPIFFAATLAIAATTSPTTRAADFDYEGQVGLAYLNRSGTPTLEIPIRPDGQLPLKPGTLITIVTFGRGPVNEQRLVQARVASGPLRFAATETKVNSPSDSYTLKGLDHEILTGGVGMNIGIANADGQCRLSKDSVRCDLEAGTPTQSFRLCLSKEHLRVSIWNGEPLEGELRWSAEHYVGSYHAGLDLEPDCTDRDY